MKNTNDSIDVSSVKPTTRNALDAELVALLRPIQDSSGVFSHALELLASMQTSPSCNRAAASVLLDSCHAIESSEPNSEESLEDYRSIYAAHLAMCEIESANSFKPQSCDQLTETAKGRPKGLGNIRKDKLSQCLRSLESKPQWWTSYSNNRQNAGVMCQAARIDIEKGRCFILCRINANSLLDHLIKLHKSMVESSAEASGALGRATNEAHIALTRLQHDFATAERTFRDKLLQELESSTGRTQSLLERLIDAADTAVQGVISRMVTSIKEVEVQTASLAKVPLPHGSVISS